MMTHRTTDDDTFAALFARIDFADEPHMATSARDDARRGRRRLIRRRVAVSVAGGVGVASVAAAVAVIAPDGPAGFGSLDQETTVMAPPPAETATPQETAPPPAEEHSPLARARLDLFAAATEHLDPEGRHLPRELHGPEGGQSGGVADVAFDVGSKLEWTVAGEDGMGELRVGITTAGYADSDPFARAQFAGNFQCHLDMDTCVEQQLPGTDLRAWVAQEVGELVVAVVVERADGSMVGMSADVLFGNNTTVPVSEVDVTLDQAFAFVADPSLRFEATLEDMLWSQRSMSVVPDEATTSVPVDE